MERLHSSWADFIRGGFVNSFFCLSFVNDNMNINDALWANKWANVFRWTRREFSGEKVDCFTDKMYAYRICQLYLYFTKRKHELCKSLSKHHFHVTFSIQLHYSSHAIINCKATETLFHFGSACKLCVAYDVLSCNKKIIFGFMKQCLSFCHYVSLFIVSLSHLT